MSLLSPMAASSSSASPVNIDQSSNVTTVPASAVIDFVETLVDVFVELPYDKLCGPLRDIDHYLSRLTECDCWHYVGRTTEAHLRTLTKQFAEVVADARSSASPQQLRLAT